MVRVCVLIFVALALGLGACSDGEPAEGDRTKPEEGEVFLEARDVVGPHAFTRSVALAAVPEVTETKAAGRDPERGGLRTVRGTATGFYGGAGSLDVCDATAALDQLTDDADKAQAWVDALNDDTDLDWSGGSKLAADDIEAYIAELTPVLLKADVRVTNHAYDAGRVTAFQSVLQRGSAVMIDALGVPRARCASFGPLIAAAPAGSPKYRGEEWDGFDKTKLVVVTPGARIDGFRIVDVHTGKTVDIAVGQRCACNRSATSSTTSTTVDDDDDAESTTTTRTPRTTVTTQRAATTTSQRPTTTAAPVTTTTTVAPTTTSTTT